MSDGSALPPTYSPQEEEKEEGDEGNLYLQEGSDSLGGTPRRGGHKEGDCIKQIGTPSTKSPRWGRGRKKKSSHACRPTATVERGEKRGSFFDRDRKRTPSEGKNPSRPCRKTNCLPGKVETTESRTPTVPGRSGLCRRLGTVGVANQLFGPRYRVGRIGESVGRRKPRVRRRRKRKTLKGSRKGTLLHLKQLSRGGERGEKRGGEKKEKKSPDPSCTGERRIVDRILRSGGPRRGANEVGGVTTPRVLVWFVRTSRSDDTLDVFVYPSTFRVGGGQREENPGSLVSVRVRNVKGPSGEQKKAISDIQAWLAEEKRGVWNNLQRQGKAKNGSEARNTGWPDETGKEKEGEINLNGGSISSTKIVGQGENVQAAVRHRRSRIRYKWRERNVAIPVPVERGSCGLGGFGGPT